MGVFWQIVWGGVIAAIVWFIIGGVLYMNPVVTRLYRITADSPSVKKWTSTPTYLVVIFVGILIQCLLWAWVYILIKPAMPDSVLGIGVMFGFILIVTKIVPRLIDMWTQSTYPHQLLTIEFVNGCLGSVVIAVVFALMI